MDYKIIKKITFIIILFFCATPLSAAKKKTYSNRDVKNIKSLLLKQKKTISAIKSKIINIEKKLSSENSKFVAVEEDKMRIDAEIYQTKFEIRKLREKVERELISTKKTFNTLVLSSLNNKRSSNNLLQQKMLQDISKIKFKELNMQLEIVTKMGKEIQASIKKLNENYELAGQISNLLVDMEAKKKMLATSYLEKVQGREKLDSKYKLARKSIKRKKRRKKVRSKPSKVSLRFLPPVMQYSSYDYDNKGITYKFQGDHNVYSTHKGKVIYSGPLSTYGNVIMLDHGNDTRSVLLGKFKPGVNKGDFVKGGQIIGKASSQMSGSGSIYFEVRYKERVQNTFNLIDKKTYSRNNTSVKQISFQGT